MRGNAISGEPIRRGVSQLPNPPIMAGITMKKNYNKGMSSNNYVKNLIVSD